MLNVVIFGAPGSGKGTQSEKIIEEYGLAHISTGDVLRKEINEGSELGKKAQVYMNEGKLVPDELIIDMLAKTLDSMKSEKGVIFDGFPRTTAQAEALKKMLNARGTDIHLVLALEVDKNELIDRLLKRGETSGRSDDNLETISKRIAVYEEQTTPVKDYYIKEKSHHAVHGIGSVHEIFAHIKDAIEKKLS